MKQKLKLRKVFLLLFSMFFALHAYSQKTPLAGTVKDAIDGSPLPGATVVIKGTSSGTATDYLGNFQINAESGNTLVFSFIGYEPREIVFEGQATLDIALNPSTVGMEELVVIGYGTVKKEDATGAVSTVSADDFNKGSISTVQDLLVGKSAGVVMTMSDGAPGSGSSIRIRGGSSLNATNEPLIIIDGVPISNNNVNGSSNFLSFINPNDIENMTILKDASATAIYGSRASNGVIIITTKKGQKGNRLSVSYDGKLSVSTPTEFLDVYSGDEIRQIAYEKRDLYGVETLDLLGTENTNWQEEIFRTALSQDHNLSLSGAYDFLPYRVSFGLTDENGILENTDMQRLTGAINLSPSFLDDDLKVNLNVKGMTTDHNFGDDGAIGSAINMDPTQPIKDGNPNSAGYYQWSNYGANLGTANPVEQALSADDKSTVQRVIANVELDYALPFVEDLHAKLNVATDITESEGHNNRPVTSPSVLTSPLNGKLSDYSARFTNDLLDFYLNYKKDITALDSRVDVTAGYSWQHFQREGKSYTRGIVDAENAYQSTDSSDFIVENYLVSFFGRLNYSVMDKYLVTFTVRNDGSSRFAEENRWGLFPSAAVAWKIHEEPFLRDINAITELKLRASWGITGQQDVLDNEYPSQPIYREASAGNYYPIGGVFLPTLRPDAYDPNIKWEETTTQNIGLDFGLFNNRVTGSVELYKRVTDDLLNEVTIPSGSNFSNTLLTNVGSLENQGIELALNLRPISTQDMSLSLGFNFTYNENKITKLLLTEDPEYIGILYGDAFTGQKQVTRVGYPAKSYFLNKQVYDANGNPIEGLYVDLSGEGGNVNGDNEDKYIYKKPEADYLIGFSLAYNYKAFDLSASSRAAIGNYVYNQLAAGASYDQLYQIGYYKNFPKYLDDTQFVKRQFTSDYFVENASFFKLDNVSAGYTFSNVVDKLSARLSFTVMNALTITKYKGLDPEVSDGIDNNFYPRPRTFVLGLNLTF